MNIGIDTALYWEHIKPIEGVDLLFSLQVFHNPVVR